MATTPTVSSNTRKRKNVDCDELSTPERKKRQSSLVTKRSRKRSENKIKHKNLITNHFLKLNLAQQVGNGGDAGLGGVQAVVGGGDKAVQGARAKIGSDLARGGKPRNFVPDVTIGQTQSAADTQPSNGSCNNS